ncbi:MAG: transferrin-binding protein-like solute binding protein, partial [Pseudomonadota bacterium]
LYYVDSNFDTNAEFEDFLPGGSASGNGGAFFQSDFVLGFPTDPTELAALANTVVDYTGSAIIGKSLPNVVGIDDAVGPAEFSVDFGTNLVTGQFDLTNSQASQSNLGGADGSLLLILEDGQVTPTGISGFVDVPEAELGDLSNTPNGLEAVRLDVEGVFYGPNAQELSGSLTGANAVVDVGNGEELVAPSDAIAGSFLTSQ